MIVGAVVAITGASSMGEAVAPHLAELGAKVVLGARGSDGRLEALAGRIRSTGGDAACISIEVTRRGDLRALVALARERFGRLNVLISSAGVMPRGPMKDLEVDDWERMVDVNVKGVPFDIAAALPVFLEQEIVHFIHRLDSDAQNHAQSSGLFWNESRCSGYFRRVAARDGEAGAGHGGRFGLHRKREKP